jgi:hypothetical protein
MINQKIDLKYFCCIYIKKLKSMEMLAEEVTEMDDYGYFVDIDNGFISTKTMIERYSDYDFKHNYEREKIINLNLTISKTTNKSLFCINTMCCMAVSILFLKIWVFQAKT